MAQKSVQQSFGGGEVSPDFWGRLSDAKYQTGLATCRNFVVLPHGPVVNRAGFAYVRPAGDESHPVRLIPFVFNIDQTMVVEFGHLYVRFHTQGSTLLSGTPPAWSAADFYPVGSIVTSGVQRFYCTAAHINQAPPNLSFWYEMPGSVYQIPTPYTGADVMGLHYVQSADVLTIVHPNYPPRELRRLGATAWVLSTISMVPTISPPAGGTVTAVLDGGTPTFPRIYIYALTLVSKATGEESLASFGGSASNDLSILGNYNTIAWTAVGAQFFVNIYKALTVGGYYGYIGTQDGVVTGTPFRDYNIIPDMSRMLPEPGVTFSTANNYPSAVTYHEQRRWFAGTNNDPLGIWATKSGTESNMSRSLIPRDDDALAFRVSSAQANRIKHLVPLGDLLPFTGGGEMRVTSINTDAITPTSVNVKTESFVGANNVQPIVANTNIVYAANRGGHMRELGYNDKAGGHATGDLSLRATHLFDTLDIVDMAYAKAPYPIVWAVSSNGKLLGLTYVPEQDIGAWHQHDTDGSFLSVCVVAEGNEDRLYAVVERTIGTTVRKYIERLATRLGNGLTNAFHVDSGLTYSGSPATTISGLGHLEGKTVSILADGAVQVPQQVVLSSVSIDSPASVVHVGLPIVSELQTLPMSMQIDAALGQGRMKNVNAVHVRVYESSLFKAGPVPAWGPYDSELKEAKWRTSEAYGSPPSLRSEEVEVVIPGDWNTEAQVLVRQDQPLPITVVSMTTDVVLGG